jgi:hypothetical protein
MLGISLFRMYWRISKLTVKTLLMEVFTASTPTSSGNYKAILETLPAEYENDTPEGFLSVERNTKRLPSLNIRGSQRVHDHDLLD